MTGARLLGSLAVAVAVALTSCSGGTADSAKKPSVAPPPPEERHDYYLVLDVDRVPVTGAVLRIQIRSTAPEGAVFGVGGTLERWAGTSWGKPVPVVFGLEMWGPESRGSLRPSSGPGFGIPAIGLPASRTVDAPREVLDVSGLEQGWFRLCQQGSPSAQACAQFEVFGDAG